MITVTATDLARRTNQVLDALAQGESVTITGNNTVPGTINPPPRPVTLREAFESLPTMSLGVAGSYKADIRNAGFDDEMGDPWQK